MCVQVLPSTYFDKGPRSSLFRFEDVFTGELIRRLPYQVPISPSRHENIRYGRKFE